MINIYIYNRGFWGTYKICCWSKCKSSKKSEKGTKERESNGHKQCKSWSKVVTIMRDKQEWISKVIWQVK